MMCHEMSGSVMRRGAGGPPRPAGTPPRSRRGAAPEKEMGLYDIIPFDMIVHICFPTRSFRSIPPFPAHPKVKQTGLPTAFFRSTQARRSRRRAGRCSYNVPYARSQARNRPRHQFRRQSRRRSRANPAPIPAGPSGRERGPGTRACARAAAALPSALPSAFPAAAAGAAPCRAMRGAARARAGRLRRGAGVVERGGLENRCALCVPWVRIPPSPPDIRLSPSGNSY